MLDTVKKTIKSIAGSKCNYCGQVVEGESFEAMVKVPGYTGKHKKSFCNQDHLNRWREFIEEWEENNHKIPESNKGSTCVNCMR